MGRDTETERRTHRVSYQLDDAYTVKESQGVSRSPWVALNAELLAYWSLQHHLGHQLKLKIA